MNRSKWFSGFVLGGLIGASVALLTAARSGEKTREMISNKGMELRDKAIDKVNDAKNLFENTKETVVDETKNRVDRLKDVGRTMMQAEEEIITESKKEAKKVIAS